MIWPLLSAVPETIVPPLNATSACNPLTKSPELVTPAAT